MSRRRNPRRAVAALRRNFVEEFSDELSENELSSDNEIDLLHILLALRSTRRKNSRRRSSTKSRSPRAASRGNKASRGGKRQQTSAPSTVNTVVNLESDNEPIDEEVKVNHLRNIENKVDNFFKSGNLLSDDDDDDLMIAKSKVKPPPKESKEFYSLTDSDEDKPSTSKLDSEDSTPTPGPSVQDKTEIVKQSKEKSDELMEIVDKILDGNEEPIEIDVEPDKNWADYKSKTEEILGSMNAILEEFKENVEEKPEEKVEEKSPQKVKPNCPICLEVLGGDIVAAATLCGHIFCHECLKKVARTSKTCPTCRKRINLKQIHPLYL